MKHLTVYSLFLLLAYSGTLFSEELFSESDSDVSQLRGLIKPKTTAVLSSEIAAQIESLPFKEGERFKKGDVLVRFDCSLYQAAYAATRAEHEASQKRLENNQQLLSLDAISNIEVDLSSISVKKTEAELRANSINVSRCKIRAPYSGRIVEAKVNEYESVSQDQELISILDDTDLEIEILVPSRWLTWLKPEQKFTFLVDETGERHAATVTRLGSVVDPVSQTIRIKAEFDNEVDVLSGMSGSADFQDAMN